MSHEYSLAHLTVLALAPLEMIDVAADAGYRYVGLRLNRVTPAEVLYPLITDKALLRETKARLSATGIRVLDVELARMDPANDPWSCVPLLETAAELGARHVITQLPDPDRDRATERFATICELAAPLGLGIDLEFPSWTETPDLSEAARVLRVVDQSNAGILVDLLHFDRSGSSLEELRSLPRRWFRFAHVCDAPAERPTTKEGLIHTARAERLFPGDGGIDVRGILSCMPQGIPYALEIPGDTLVGRIGLREYARRALRRAQEHLDCLETATAAMSH
jgi:sugar phosphate isomerase/epimerase